MSRRIAYLLVIAASATIAAPASADRECFDNTCRMPEVIELPPEPPPAAADEPAQAIAASPRVVPGPVVERRGPPDVAPQMAVDDPSRPVMKPSPHKAAPAVARTRAPSRPPAEDAADKGVPQEMRQASGEPVEVVSRRYAAAEPPGYTMSHPSHPGAGVVVVVPGVQYGADGIGLVEGRQNSAWQLCQTERNDSRCTPYNYQPFGAYGYRPLGSYRVQRNAPAHAYVPGARIITIEND